MSNETEQEFIPKLTGKQQAFLNRYLVDFNATQAALEAGYSEKTAYAIGGNLLKKVEIQNAIRAHQIQMARQAVKNVEWVLAQLFERYAALVEKGDDKGAIKALELIGRHYGAFPNRVELDVKDPDEGNLVEYQNIERARRLVFLLRSVRDGNPTEVEH